MTTVCHFSDWHGEWGELPKADIYVCTGDMLYNYPKMRGSLDYRREVFLQSKETKRLKCRKHLGNPDAPVVTMRGNHDFVPLGPLFSGGPVYEIDNEHDIFEIEGLLFGGSRGINFIGGHWSDEKSAQELSDIGLALSTDIDVLVTHAPPYGILDEAPSFNGVTKEKCGVNGFASYAIRREYSNLCPKKLKLHCFGHIHECFGTLQKGALFSNAATGWHLIEVNSAAALHVRSAQPFR